MIATNNRNMTLRKPTLIDAILKKKARDLVNQKKSIINESPAIASDTLSEIEQGQAQSISKQVEFAKPQQSPEACSIKRNDEDQALVNISTMIKKNHIMNDDAQSIKQSASSNMVEVKPNIKILNKAYSLEELIAIAKLYQDPNAPYVVEHRMLKDGSSTIIYSDGTIEKKASYKNINNNVEFDPELKALINWYRNEGPLPIVPFKRSIGWSIKDHKEYYAMLDEWIELGYANLLKTELACLKKISEFIKKKEYIIP